MNCENIDLLFTHYLQRLKHIVSVVESHQSAQHIINSRLTDDMLPFSSQVRIVCNFALRGYCPLLGQPTVSFDNNDHSYAGLNRQIEDSLAFIHNNPLINNQPLQVNLAGEKAGMAEVELSPEDFVFRYIIPNQLFHLSIVYTIARKDGVALSKGDFDGIHQYPANFSFEN